MAAKGRRKATFNDDLPRRIRFEREARQKGLRFEVGYRGA
jgi:hypothetical protein